MVPTFFEKNGPLTPKTPGKPGLKQVKENPAGGDKEGKQKPGGARDSRSRREIFGGYRGIRLSPQRWGLQKPPPPHCL